MRQRGCQYPLASRTPGPVFSDTRPGGVTAGPLRIRHGLEPVGPLRTPLRPWTVVTPSPTSRFIVASASSGTQPTVSVCWATQLFVRSRHVAPVAQSRVALPAARYELLEHRRQQTRPLLRVLAQPTLAVAFPLRMPLVALILRLHAHHPAVLAEDP